MELHELTPQLSVSPQLNIEDIDKAAAAGFKTIICNRPDGEGDDQPASEEMQALCQSLGIKWHFLPVSPKDYTDSQALEFGELINQLPAPILAYCRTGTRCTNLWALSQADQRDTDEIILSAKNAGYDLSKLRDRITNMMK